MKPIESLLIRDEMARLTRTKTRTRARELLRASNIKITRRRVIPRYGARSPDHVKWDAAQHPRGIAYEADALTRAIAHLQDHPEWIASSWSAATLLGVHDFSDGMDSTFFSGTSRLVKPTVSWTAQLRPTRPTLEVTTKTAFGVRFRTVSPGHALISCLLDIRGGEACWNTPAVPGLSRSEVQSIQVIDGFRRHLGLGGDDIVSAGMGRIAAEELRRLVELSAADSDSKPETVLRLYVEKVAKEFGLTVVTQWEVRAGDGSIITRFDVAIVELKLGFMYDGVHHFENSDQRAADAEIGNALQFLGWKYLRVTWKAFRSPEATYQRIGGLVEQQLRISA